MARTKKKALWVFRETTFSTAGAGGSYLAVPALMIGDLKEQKAVLETNYFTGRNHDTAPIPGVDGWALDIEVPLIGLSAAAGNTVAPPTADWLDYFLEHIFGTVGTTNGSTLVAHTSAAITLAADTLNPQHIVPLFGSTASFLTPNRTWWSFITAEGGGGAYTIDLAPPGNFAGDGTTIGYGTRHYRISDAGGPTLSFQLREDEVDYVLHGGRCQTASINMEPGQIARLKMSFQGDRITQQTLSSLPNLAAAPSITPIRGTISPVRFNGAHYATRAIDIDLGIAAHPVEASAETNARAGWESIAIKPTITIQPLRTDAIRNMKRNGTKGRLTVQLGAGVLDADVLNTIGIHGEEAIAIEADVQDDNGIMRQAVKFKITDKVYLTGSTESVVFQVSRG